MVNAIKKAVNSVQNARWFYWVKFAVNVARWAQTIKAVYQTVHDLPTWIAFVVDLIFKFWM